jgi:hypothetical protein
MKSEEGPMAAGNVYFDFKTKIALSVLIANPAVPSAVLCQ